MNRIAKLSAVVTFVVGTCLSNVSHAIVLSIQPVVTRFYDPLTFASLPTIPAGVNPGVPVLVEVGVYMEVLSLGPGEDGFGLAAFSFDLRGNDPGEIFPDPEAGGWAANNFSWDLWPLPGFISLFYQNGDSGPSNFDLKGILIQMALGPLTGRGDPRRDVGEPGSSLGVPFLLGYGYLEWNGLDDVAFTLNPIQAGAKLTNGQFVSGITVPSATIVLGNNVPEPSSLVLLGICLAGLVIKR